MEEREEEEEVEDEEGTDGSIYSRMYVEVNSVVKPNDGIRGDREEAKREKELFILCWRWLESVGDRERAVDMAASGVVRFGGRRSSGGCEYRFVTTPVFLLLDFFVFFFFF